MELYLAKQRLMHEQQSMKIDYGMSSKTKKNYALKIYKAYQMLLVMVVQMVMKWEN
uniref:Uncharacterized protein n=1 Tax=Arundo donax TaxID=35708 RepID=A0A0A8YIQ0_ARUDO